jgi:hypothetical protein
MFYGIFLSFLKPVCQLMAKGGINYPTGGQSVVYTKSADDI